MSVSLVSGGLALVASGCLGTSNFFGGLASRRTSAMSAVIWMELVGVPPTLAVALIANGMLSPANIASGVALGAVAAAALVCYYQALSGGAMMVAAPIVGALSAALPVLIGLATGDRLHGLQFAGLITAVIAIGIVGLQRGGGTASRRGVVLAVTAGTLFGAAYIFSKAGASGGAWTAMAARCTAAILVASAARASHTSTVPARAAWRLVVAAALADTVGFLLVLLAFRDGALSVTSVLASLYPAFTILLGWAVLHERLQPTQKAGVVLALIAVAMIGSG